MLRFIGKRLVYAIITLFLIATATFFLVAGAPGDPIAAKVGQMPEQAQEIISAKYGLDKPVFERYLIYMKRLITTGDFGESIIYTGKSANDVIKRKHFDFRKNWFNRISVPDYHRYLSWNGLSFKPRKGDG